MQDRNPVLWDSKAHALSLLEYCLDATNAGCKHLLNSTEVSFEYLSNGNMHILSVQTQILSLYSNVGEKQKVKTAEWAVGKKWWQQTWKFGFMVKAGTDPTGKGQRRGPFPTQPGWGRPGPHSQSPESCSISKLRCQRPVSNPVFHPRTQGRHRLGHHLLCSWLGCLKDDHGRTHPRSTLITKCAIKFVHFINVHLAPVLDVLGQKAGVRAI